MLNLNTDQEVFLLDLDVLYTKSGAEVEQRLPGIPLLGKHNGGGI
jgi:hypothetical protein